jgi:predicted metal-dependent hydrolase
VDNFIQDELFEVTLPLMPAKSLQNRKSTKNLLPNLADLPTYQIIRTAKRKRNLVAFRNNGIIEIHAPLRLSLREIEAMVPEMIRRVSDQEIARAKGNDFLEKMAAKIIENHLPQLAALVKEQPISIAWRTMNERWGSCTWKEHRIRISHRLCLAPDYVIASVLFHELAHLIEHDHGPRFRELLKLDPNLEKCESFLEGFEYGSTHGKFERSEDGDDESKLDSGDKEIA